MTEALGAVLADGELVAPDEAVVSIFDIGLQRGYGCFEALRSYGGVPFRMHAHLDRLQASAAKLRLDLPTRADLEAWVRDRAGSGGDCVVRVIVTGGTSLVVPGTSSRTFVFAEPIPPVPAVLRVMPVPAPWHSDQSEWGLTGAKTLSYAPNVAAALAARAEGFDDALLVGDGEIVLEGPTYSVGWVRRGVLETPSLGVGILESITRGAVLEMAAAIGCDTVEGAFRLERLLEADEVICMSTVKEVRPIVAVGETTFVEGPVTQRLAAEYQALVRSEVGEA